jgi:hypothetical protein
MSLVDVNLPDAMAAVGDEESAFLREADRRINEYLDARSDRNGHGFVPSDFVAVHLALRAIVDGSVAPGNTLCEWGSGLGVVASLATMLGFDAWGIEIDHELVTASEALADEFDLPVSFVCGNFIPPGSEGCADDMGDLAWLAMGGANAYEEMGLDTEDFDVIFAYPWPGEEHVIAEMFDRHAAVGAVLLTHHGLEGMRLRRKVLDGATRRN